MNDKIWYTHLLYPVTWSIEARGLYGVPHDVIGSSLTQLCHAPFFRLWISISALQWARRGIAKMGSALALNYFQSIERTRVELLSDISRCVYLIRSALSRNIRINSGCSTEHKILCHILLRWHYCIQKLGNTLRSAKRSSAKADAS